MKTRTFDCVEMKRRGAEHVYGIIKDMTLQEEVEYWWQRTEELRQEQRRLNANPPAPQDKGPGLPSET